MGDEDKFAEQAAGRTAAGEPRIVLVDDAGIIQVTEG
jgi:hypothetical protein